MNNIDLKNFFCAEILEKVSDNLFHGFISPLEIKEHFENCEYCKNGFNELLKKSPSPVIPILINNLITKLKE